MRYLIDTHVFIWATINAKKLSPKVQAILEDAQNSILLSLASVWEMQIKIQTGKFIFDDSLPEVIALQEKNKIQRLPIELSHIYGLESLPIHHRDPFDRMLISQAIVEDIPFITDDSQISKYPVKVVW